MKKIIIATLTLMVACCAFLTMALPVSACTPSSPREITGDEASGIISTDGIFTFELSTQEDSYYITDCQESASGEIIIPSTYKGLPVTKLGANAFEGCRKITSVQIPDTITEILCNTFYGCTALETIDLPKTTQYIGYSTFEGCDSLKSFTINGKLTEKGNTFTQKINGTEYSSHYFVRDGILFLNTDIYIGKNLKYKPINHNTLIKYPLAKPERTYTVPSDINEIWTDAFSSLKHLEKVTIPSSVTSLYSQCFHGYGYNHESPLTVIFQHTTFANDLLTSYALYDMPTGSKIVVENEEIKDTIEALDPAFSTLFGTEEKLTIEVNCTSTIVPPDVEKKFVLFVLETIMQLLKNYTGAFI